MSLENHYNKLCLSYKDKYKQKEEWRMVIYKGITTPYAVSNYGRIFDLDKMEIPEIEWHKMTYFIIKMKLDTGKHKRIGIYRLVAMAFIPIPQRYIDAGYTEDDLVVDHIRDCEEDNHDDNTIWNLQWLTSFENSSKYNNIAFSDIRKPFSVEFRRELDEMILNGDDNNTIYKTAKEKYGYEKYELKSNLQVRRRRLGKTLKEHHEYDKYYINKIDDFLKKGYSNEEIMNTFDMPASETSYMRLLKYRRKILKIPANVSKYLNNDQNKKLNELISSGMKPKEILNEMINLYSMKLSDNDKIKFKSTITSRIYLYKNRIKNNTSLTTIESIV